MNAYEKWLDFSTRMARTVFDATPERVEKLVDKITWFIELFKDSTIVGWDHEHTEHGYVTDAVGEAFEEYRVFNNLGEQTGKFYNQITCAIRSGLDMANHEQASSGVVGFTVGDLRKMYNEGIPDWVSSFYEPPLSIEAKDDEHVWL